jgi:hypothetical protein
MLILSAVADRKTGNVKRFDVVRADDTDYIVEAAEGLPEGAYKALTGDRVVDFSTGYRTVQDIEVDGKSTTIPA